MAKSSNPELQVIGISILVSTNWGAGGVEVWIGARLSFLVIFYPLRDICEVT